MSCSIKGRDGLGFDHLHLTPSRGIHLNSSKPQPRFGAGIVEAQSPPASFRVSEVAHLAGDAQKRASGSSVAGPNTLRLSQALDDLSGDLPQISVLGQLLLSPALGQPPRCPGTADPFQFPSRPSTMALL